MKVNNKHRDKKQDDLSVKNHITPGTFGNAWLNALRGKNAETQKTSETNGKR